MIKNYLVSIIIPTYNCGKYIAETLDSVEKQTYKNWEIIIIDDCSSDETKNIVSEYSRNDSRISYHCLDKNSGPAVARNRGLEFASGRYIAFLDSDDLWYPEKLERQISWMQINHYDISCTRYALIDEHGEMLGIIKKPLDKVDYKKLLLGNRIGNSTVIYDRYKIGNITVPLIRKRNDYALWLKILKKEQYVFGFQEVLMYYRIRKDSVTRSSSKFSLIKYHWELFRNIEHLSYIQSFGNIIYLVITKLLKLQ